MDNQDKHENEKRSLGEAWAKVSDAADYSATMPFRQLPVFDVVDTLTVALASALERIEALEARLAAHEAQAKGGE